MEDAGQFHDERRARPIVIQGFTLANAVHVGANDVHLLRTRRADLRAEDFLALSGCAGFGVQLTELLVRLGVGVADDAAAALIAVGRGTAFTVAPHPFGRTRHWRRRRSSAT